MKIPLTSLICPAGPDDYPRLGISVGVSPANAASWRAAGYDERHQFTARLEQMIAHLPQLVGAATFLVQQDYHNPVCRVRSMSGSEQDLGCDCGLRDLGLVLKAMAVADAD